MFLQEMFLRFSDCLRGYIGLDNSMQVYMYSYIYIYVFIYRERVQGSRDSNMLGWRCRTPNFKDLVLETIIP